jgi:lysophospholipase L1-like esterase
VQCCAATLLFDPFPSSAAQAAEEYAMISSLTTIVRNRFWWKPAFVLAVALGCTLNGVWADVDELEHRSSHHKENNPEIPAGTLIFANKVSPEFQQKIVQIAQDLGTDPNFLMAIMEFESGINPARQNKSSKATGLIQFLPSTAKGLRTTVDALQKMTAEEQLPFVARYFASYKGKIKTIEDAYMAVLFPRAMGKPNDYVLFTKDDKDPRNYNFNKGLDANKDGKVTKEEAAAPVRAALKRGLNGGTSPVAPVKPTPTGSNSAARPTARGDDLFKKRHQLLRERARKGNVDVLFLGDSITQGWGSAGLTVFKKQFEPLKAANFGIVSDRTQNVLWRVTEGKELDGIQPRVVVLLIGTNNIGSNRPADIAEGVAAIIKAVQKQRPETQFLLMGIFPRGLKATDPLRKQVQDTNTALVKLTNGSNIRFVDMGTSFLDSTGTLRKDLLPDLLHPNARGYALWAQAIDQPLANMLGNTSVDSE